MLKYTLFAVLLGLLAPSPFAQADDGLATLPPKINRAVFLGDSITYGGKYVAYIETYFITRHPDRQVEFINVGLPSETVSGLSERGHAGGRFPRPDLHERLSRVLQQTKPDMVFACYGMNDGIYLPLSNDRFGKFQDGMNWLHDQLAQAGVTTVHVTPPAYDGQRMNNPAYNDTLRAYSDWMLGRRDDKWDVVDLNGPMVRDLEARRKKDPRFAFAADGVHPAELGHWVIARQILEHLGARDVTQAADVGAMLAAYPKGQQILDLVVERQNLTKDAWLTAIGHKRPGMNRGLPQDRVKARSAEIEKQIRKLVE